MSQMPKIDMYNLLGIHQTASPDQIKKAYRIRVKGFFPDFADDALYNHALAVTKQLTVAWEWLAEPGKRTRYDLFYASAKFKQSALDSFKQEHPYLADTHKRTVQARTRLAVQTDPSELEIIAMMNPKLPDIDAAIRYDLRKIIETIYSDRQPDSHLGNFIEQFA